MTAKNAPFSVLAILAVLAVLLVIEAEKWLDTETKGEAIQIMPYQPKPGDLVTTKIPIEAYYSNYEGCPEQWFLPGNLGVFITTAPSVVAHPDNPSGVFYVIDFYGLPYGPYGKTIWRVALWKSQESSGGLGRRTMKIVVDGKTTSIRHYVDNRLDGSDYDTDAIRAAAITAENCSEAIGRLCEVLAKKRIISLPNVTFVATGHRDLDYLIWKFEEVEDDGR